MGIKKKLAMASLAVSAVAAPVKQAEAHHHPDPVAAALVGGVVGGVVGAAINQATTPTTTVVQPVAATTVVQPVAQTTVVQPVAPVVVEKTVVVETPVVIHGHHHRHLPPPRPRHHRIRPGCRGR